MRDQPAADRSPETSPDIESRPPRPWWAIWLLSLGAAVLVAAVIPGWAAASYPSRVVSSSGALLTPSEVANAIVLADRLARLAIVGVVAGVFLLIAGAVAWFRFQYSLRTLMLLVTAFAVLCSLLATFNQHQKPYRTVVHWCSPHHKLYSTYCEETLLYGFVADDGVPLTMTNSLTDMPAPVGIHWRDVGPDGLWFKGKKVAIPADCPVFAILDDGRVVPIPLTDAELATLAGNFPNAQFPGWSVNPQLNQKLTAPFRGGGAAGGAEKRQPPWDSQ